MLRIAVVPLLAAVPLIAAGSGDAALLSRTLPTARHRRFALAVSIGWGTLSVAGLLLGDGRGRCRSQRG
ncbi:hypothetical protein [Kitasatospora viridis]|uniref:Uncharacterized protein n=1 Tax=Kitasatospora viridis TaxID=281105 RepID=A0A561SDD1_9ACTN|nr:hypothetical protein [Kitasatospora viridis]TWF72881.1 hypothetical protein FHX73_1632 [Kitasatospora viridis]